MVFDSWNFKEVAKVKKRLSSFILVGLFVLLVPFPIFAREARQDNPESKEQSIVKLTDESYTTKSNEYITLNFCNKPEMFSVKSNAFNSGEAIPIKYVCTSIPGGSGISIPLQWSGAPKNTKSFAIFMYDTHPVAKNFVHWSVINIPNNVVELKAGVSGTENMPKGSVELINSSSKIGYMGPCPPVGTGKHQYKIIVYALNTETLNLSGSTSLSHFKSAVSGKVLAESELIGYYE